MLCSQNPWKNLQQFSCICQRFSVVSASRNILLSSSPTQVSGFSWKLQSNWCSWNYDCFTIFHSLTMVAVAAILNITKTEINLHWTKTLQKLPDKNQVQNERTDESYCPVAWLYRLRNLCPTIQCIIRSLIKKIVCLITLISQYNTLQKSTETH